MIYLLIKISKEIPTALTLYLVIFRAIRKFRVQTKFRPFVCTLRKRDMKDVCLRKRWGKCYMRNIVKVYMHF